MEKLRQTFQKDGIVIVPKVVSLDLIDDLYKTLVSLFKIHFLDLFNWCDKEIDHTIWDEENFHHSIIEARKRDPVKFGAIYDAIQLTASAKKILVYNEILEIISFITETDITNISCRNSIIRMDCPYDERNSLNWHTDEFTRNEHDPKDGITVNMAFHDIMPKHGSPLFLLNSNKEKNIQTVSVDNDNTISDYYSIKDSIIDKYEIFQPNSFSLGDIVIFPMNLIHKSGENISDRVRLSGVFRYYPIHSKTYLFQREEILDNEIKI